MDPKTLDPKGLMKDAYRIDGITEPECRSIFLDWALGLPMDADPKDWITRVLALYENTAPSHPMTRVLSEGLTGQASPMRPARRGGRGARRRTANR